MSVQRLRGALCCGGWARGKAPASPPPRRGGDAVQRSDSSMRHRPVSVDLGNE